MVDADNDTNPKTKTKIEIYFYFYFYDLLFYIYTKRRVSSSRQLQILSLSQLKIVGQMSCSVLVIYFCSEFRTSPVLIITTALIIVIVHSLLHPLDTKKLLRTIFANGVIHGLSIDGTPSIAPALTMIYNVVIKTKIWPKF